MATSHSMASRQGACPRFLSPPQKVLHSEILACKKICDQQLPGPSLRICLAPIHSNTYLNCHAASALYQSLVTECLGLSLLLFMRVLSLSWELQPPREIPPPVLLDAWILPLLK